MTFAFHKYPVNNFEASCFLIVASFSEQPPQFEESSDFFETIPTSIDTFQNQQPYEQTLPNEPETSLPQSSNLTSVFSSFSNILKLKTPQNPPPTEFIPPPAGIETILEQPPVDVAPIPLFPASGITSSAPKNPPQGPANTYRRSGLKRPVYAQIPGLSNQQPVVQPPPPQTSSYFQPQAVLPEVTPPHSVSPVVSSVSSTQDTGVGYFKPISPQPSSFLSAVTTSQTFTPISVPAQHNFFPPVSSTNSYLQSPVMAAISANDCLQPGNVVPPLSTEIDGDKITANGINQIYRPVYHHWFHKREVEGKVLWQQFSMVDSLALEQAFTSNDLDPDKEVATDGGRYDVNILRRQRIPVYWKGAPTEVRRCSWFYKGNSDGKYVPYEENIATKLEEEFKSAFEQNHWHRKVELPNGETVVFHAPDVLVLFPPSQSPDAWGNTPNQLRPRVVKRGMDEFDIDEGEPEKVDHLLFLVHGIGSVCDLKFRTVEEVVDEFRSISLQLVQSHYRSSCERGLANRVEVLPISWHEELHSENTGIDRKLKSITLESIPRLRDFTNDTLLDVLFYTSPVYCQTVISTVGNQLNRIYELFKQRNPDFNGGVSLGGHSLGSLILFDLLCHQQPEPEKGDTLPEDDETVVPVSEKPPPLQRRMSKRISYMMGAVGTGQPQIHYPNLVFQPKSFFALGSPIGMFVTVRGLDTLGEQFALPTCPAFFNIFHPYDPVAYRVESLINPELAKLKPVLIPHHKGRKRMHLELKETMARVGADLKQRVIDSMKNTWNSFYQLAMFHRQDEATLEEEVDKALQKQILEQEDVDEEPEQQQTDQPLGLLNSNRRIDYVLQEAPFEFFNEYLFALTSHVCYWESEDTMLLILKEIYSNMNVTADDKIPQQTMSIERPPPSPKSLRAENYNHTNDVTGMDPTAPIQRNVNLGPPPMTGFVKKT
ncbi:hypothetical protein Zmor_003430 [Zophobas morio]|uniref:DDHD domain-containing protein n=1 Tax=Zophobas morio TaxID=2755281 RepID=A0AA38HMM4_9CUCU|nr:hypothetical protein Zmor_003430 [Zophobas morio]